MTVVFVTFRFPVESFDPERYNQIAYDRRIAYEGLPGLILKIYWNAPDRAEAGAVYLWNTRQQAEAVYTEEWCRRAGQAFGVEPEVWYADSPDVLQNLPIPHGR